MLIPARETGDLKKFVDKYFIPDDIGGVLLTDEKVRILYYESDSQEMYHPHVKKRLLHFDIFVLREELYTADPVDRMRRRDKMIHQRLMELLLGKTYQHGLRFAYWDDIDMGAKTAGYKRYHSIFSYVKSF
jgi:hypothetical protein